MQATRYYHLALTTGQSVDDRGAPVAWAACEDLPGAYEEGPTSEAARRAVHDLVRRIIAEHIVRDDPLDPVITATTHVEADHAADPTRLVVAVSAMDIEEARNAPLLYIEQPEP